MDITQSLIFVEGNGSSLELARLSCIIHGNRPVSAVVQPFLELQNTDGGFPFGMIQGNLTTVNESTVALWWMEELGMLSSAEGKRVFEYLFTNQQEDGSWDEDPHISQYDLPPWIQLGDPKTRLYLTAYATYWLAVAEYTSHAAFRKALHFLIRNQEPSGKFYGYLHTTWIAAGVFLLAGPRYTRIANQALDVLYTRSLDDLDDSQIAWGLDCISKGGLPKTHPLVDTWLAELLRRQQPDGSWAGGGGQGFAVGATIQVLKVFKRYGLFSEI